MSQQILDIYTVDSLQPNESVFHSADTFWLSHNHSFALPMSLMPRTWPTFKYNLTGALLMLYERLYEDGRLSLCSLFLLFTIIIPALCKMGS